MLEKAWLPEWYKLKQAKRKNKKSSQLVFIDHSPSSVSHVAQVSSKEDNSGLALVSSSSPNA